MAIASVVVVAWVFVSLPDLPIRWVGVGSRKDTADLVAFLAAHRINPVIDSVHDFSEASHAMRRLASGQHVGKVVITL